MAGRGWRRTLAPAQRRTRFHPAPAEPAPREEILVALRIVVGLVITVVAFAIAGRRLRWLQRLAMAGQPAPERARALREHPGRGAETQLTEVLGQRKLLRWSVPGAAHALTFWGFIVLLLTIIEAYGDLFSKTFAIPGIGHWAWVGFGEDLFAVAVLAGIATFACC
jgi:hypothetical protein